MSIQRLFLTAAFVFVAFAAQAIAAEDAAYSAWDRTQAQVDAGKYDEALQTAREAVMAAPGSWVAWMAVGLAREERNELDQAMAAYQKASRLAPSRALPLARVTWVHSLLGQYAEMEKAARKTLALAPDLPSAWRYLAMAQWNLGRYADAERNYRMAIRLDPGNGRYKAFLAGLLVDMNREPEAQALYREAIALEENNAAEIHASLAWSLQNTGDVAGSLAEAQEAVRLGTYPRSKADAYNAQAYALMYLQRLPEATEAIGKGLKLSPEDAYLLDTAANIALLQGNLPEAERLLTQAMNTRRGENYINPTLPLLWARQGKRAEALAQLAKVEANVKATGGVVDDYYLGGKAAAELGETARARALFAEGKRRFPGNPWSVEMRQWLAEHK